MRLKGRAGVLFAYLVATGCSGGNGSFTQGAGSGTGGGTGSGTGSAAETSGDPSDSPPAGSGTFNGVNSGSTMMAPWCWMA